jgi:hypothetical protein
MPDSLIILLCCITVSISVWLVNVLRAFYKDFHVVTALPPNPYVSGRPKLSRLLVLYWKFTEGLRPFTWFFYGYGQNKRRKILRTIVVVVGILPASIVGIFLLLIDTDKSTALLLLALGAILILLLRMLYLYSRNGMLDGGGGSDKYPEGFYIGNAKLPRKIYVGDSRNLFINLRPSVYPLSQQVSITHGSVIFGELRKMR